MSPIAITGATGFVGQAVIAAAGAQGLPVRALARREQPAQAGVQWVSGALDDADALNKLCDGAGAVLHIAGAVNVPTRAAFAAANIAGTEAIVGAARAAGVNRFVHVSSLAAREPALSNYGWSKAEGERVAREEAAGAIIVRPPGVYGPHDRDMLEVFRMASRGLVLLPPPGRASYIHVDDLAALLLTLSTARDVPTLSEPSDGTPLTHVEMAQTIGRAVGRARVRTLSAPRALLLGAAAIDRLARGEGARLTPDRARYMAHPDWVAAAALQPDPALWAPAWNFARGTAMTADWYRAHGWID